MFALGMAGLSGTRFHAQDAAAARVRVMRPGTLFQDVWPADFDGDGITDLAGSPGPADASGPLLVVVAHGAGDGTFGAPAAVGAGERVAGVGDFNGDHRVDLIVAPRRGVTGPVSVLSGNGNGTFGP